MTDEIRITRRVALPLRFEFYELEIKIVDPSAKNVDSAIEMFEKKVAKIRKELGEPSPEISTKSESIEQGDVFADLQRADVADLVILKGNVATLTGWVDENMFKKIHGILRTAGYKWVKDGKDSRWER